MAKARKANNSLLPWVRRIERHIYYCVEKYADPEIMRQRISSAIYHVTDQHEWYNPVSKIFIKILIQII